MIELAIGLGLLALSGLLALLALGLFCASASSADYFEERDL